MTEIEKKARALLNEVRVEYPLISSEVASNLALCRAIEQHEAFRQEVSDAVEQAQTKDWDVHPVLWRFIIAKPDPLAEAWIEATGNTVGMGPLNEAIAKRGGKIVWED